MADRTALASERERMKAMMAVKNEPTTTPARRRTRTSSRLSADAATPNTRRMANQGPGEGRSREDQGAGGGEAQGDDQDGPGGRTSGDPQNEGLGQRISKQGLEDRTREGQSSSNQESEEDPR